MRQRAAGSLSAACLRTLASRAASSRRALHVTAAAAATEVKEETFTYQAEVCICSYSNASFLKHFPSSSI